MHRRTTNLLLCIVVAIGAVALPGRTEILDRIAASVDGHIITLSDIRQERLMLTVLEDPVDGDGSILHSLIDRHLMEEEIAQFPGLDVSSEEVEMQMARIKDFRGLAPAAVRKAITQKLQRKLYFDQRYRQFVVVSNDEIRNYYEKEFTPEAQKRGIAVPDLDQVTGAIRNNVFEGKVSKELDLTLERLRARSNIEIFE